MNKNCKICRKEFDPAKRGYTAVTCSKKCRKKWNVIRTRNHRSTDKGKAWLESAKEINRKKSAAVPDNCKWCVKRLRYDNFRNCKHCGVRMVIAGGSKKFCSSRCTYAFLNPPKKIICHICGTHFLTTSHKKETCSVKCKLEFKMFCDRARSCRKTQWRVISCAVCKSDFKTNKPAKCCSEKCSVSLRKSRMAKTRKTDAYREKGNQSKRIQRETLSDTYVRQMLAKQSVNLQAKDFPPEMVELERQQILLKRTIKNQNEKHERTEGNPQRDNRQADRKQNDASDGECDHERDGKNPCDRETGNGLRKNEGQAAGHAFHSVGGSGSVRISEAHLNLSQSPLSSATCCR